MVSITPRGVCDCRQHTKLWVMSSVRTTASGRAELLRLCLQGTAQASGNGSTHPSPWCRAAGCALGHTAPFSRAVAADHPVPLPVRVDFCSLVEIGFSLISFLCCHIKSWWFLCMLGRVLCLLQAAAGCFLGSGLLPAAESMDIFVVLSPTPVQMHRDPTSALTPSSPPKNTTLGIPSYSTL